MELVVDARGMPCPQPVIRVRNAMREADVVVAWVSGEDNVANIRRLADKSGWQMEVTPRDDGYALRLSRLQAARAPAAGAMPTAARDAVPPTGPTVVVMRSNVMGSGVDELGGILVRSFFHTLAEIQPQPDVLVFYNAGVRLAAQGSPILDDLTALAEQGVEILVCGTCLKYLALEDKLAVGSVSNMYTIAETLLSAGRLLAP
ncbi:MAG: sulfurtransferase-like selenium metabolism protein YedF [Chloroflexota bacterium]